MAPLRACIVIVPCIHVRAVPTTRCDQWQAGEPRGNSATPWTSAFPLNGLSKPVAIAINPIEYNKQMSVPFSPPIRPRRAPRSDLDRCPLSFLSFRRPLAGQIFQLLQLLIPDFLQFSYSSNFTIMLPARAGFLHALSTVGGYTETNPFQYWRGLRVIQAEFRTWRIKVRLGIRKRSDCRIPSNDHCWPGPSGPSMLGAPRSI